MDRVYGPDLKCSLTFANCRKKGYTHFLYGGAPGVAEELQQKLGAKFPGIKFVGTYYRPHFSRFELDLGEGGGKTALIRMVAEKKPDIFWGRLMSTPKQEKFAGATISVSKLDATLFLRRRRGLRFSRRTRSPGRALPDATQRSGMALPPRLRTASFVAPLLSQQSAFPLPRSLPVDAAQEIRTELN